MTLRTKSEQKAYLDGFEMCAECIEKYLSNKGKKVLECLLISVRNAVEIEDISEQERTRMSDIEKAKDHIKNLANDYKCCDNTISFEEALALNEALENPCKENEKLKQEIKALKQELATWKALM